MYHCHVSGHNHNIPLDGFKLTEMKKGLPRKANKTTWVGGVGLPYLFIISVNLNPLSRSIIGVGLFCSLNWLWQPTFEDSDLPADI